MVKKCKFWKSKSEIPYAEELTVFIKVNIANLNEYSNWILDKDKRIVKDKREITKINIVKKYLSLTRIYLNKFLLINFSWRVFSYMLKLQIFKSNFELFVNK